ncbi:hypothetical protein BBK36DRAFT_1166611 [Trichoderma citrinoviride]|uniref:Acetylserotonin methytransferase-like protein n=1 Tax=Trichoderma citrinoviride TaxID=58853 RepID=A0A2T4BHJ2_9HYPO|nr:hypothetical protein BBK36DRAFT_1166611 [Trichoderma citrinoviride]PTB68719.1 hypothetical protein BBK36DRAFT_1166611 [Trichoderma citrinoviride]
MASHQRSGSASFSLFPSPNFSKPHPVVRTRRSESHERRAATPQQQTQDSLSPSPNGRQTPQQRAHTPLEFNPPLQEVSEAASDHEAIPPAIVEDEQPDGPGVGPSRPARVQQPRLTLEVPRPTGATFAPPQVFASNNIVDQPRNSIAKPPLFFEAPPTHEQPPALRSMFPTYNPELPLDQQNYGPLRSHPPGVPRAVVSRQSYLEDPDAAPEHPAVRDPGFRVPTRSQNPPIIPAICTTEQLQDLWKVTNGWKASFSEGRVYCLKLTQQKDAPVYTLSSTSQPFYNLRLDPTSASAYVSLTRYDPSKVYKAPKQTPPSAASILNHVMGGNSRASDGKYWQEALNTTLEEESRKHSPNDGLAALLMPCAATKIALDRPDDPATVAAAERECGRLVWDDDSSSYYVVHPALATPFCVTVEHCPAWSRVEYTLEHHESPQHLAKLTRDGTGTGWLEIDTGVASKIESFYIVDVAVTALLLVAAMEDRSSPNTVMEAFEAPPVPEPPRPSRSISSALSRHRDNDDGRKKKDKKDKRRGKMDQFEIDIESQNDSLGKDNKKTAGEDKLPFILRVIVKLTKGVFNCFIWILTIGFACVKGVFKVLYKCVGSKY